MISGDASWTTVAMILFVVVGCILVVFLGYLVRSAYEMRIGLKAQMDRGLRAVEEEGQKRARGLRQELGADIERARTHLFEEARRRLGDAVASLEARQLEVEKAARQERVDTAMTLDALRDQIAVLRRRIEELERELLVGGGTASDEIASAYTLGGAITPSAAAVVPNGVGSEQPRTSGPATTAPSTR